MELNYSEVNDAIEAIGLDYEDTIIARYEGRGGVGPCMALRYDNVGEVLEFVAELSKQGCELDWVGNCRTDSLGRNGLVYWPNVTIADAPEDA